MFKVGDKVTQVIPPCIWQPEYNVRGVAVVESVRNGSTFRLIGSALEYDSSRFKKVECKNSCTIFSPVQDVTQKIHDELEYAIRNWPKFNSQHEGFAVLKEEVDELWDEVKVNQKKRDLEKTKKECIQVAAMAMRFYLEVTDETNGRK